MPDESEWQLFDFRYSPFVPSVPKAEGAISRKNAAKPMFVMDCGQLCAV